ncbi:MAG: HEAT repeat domain-containing protein [Firmicutes bacterium]|nr:HEAT repeat domain-containing protein [Bacillota bacterium]
MFGITVEKIEKWKTKNKTDKIVKAMNHKDNSIRIAAIKAAGSMKNEQILNTLIVFLRDDPNPSIRMNAAEALGNIGNPRAQDHLAYVGENDSDEKVREKAQEAMKVIISKKLKSE